MSVNPELVRGLVLDHLQDEGIEAPLRSFVDYCVDLLDVHRIDVALGDVDGAYYDDWLRDEAIAHAAERRAA